MAGRQVVVAESAATQCTKEALGLGKHTRPKYDITEGLGSESDIVICTECAKEREERPAITAYRRKLTHAGKPGVAVEQPVVTSRPVAPSGFDWREKHWGWLVLGACLLFVSKSLWGWAAIFAVWALVFFLFLRPMRCHSLTRGTAERCRSWARGSCGPATSRTTRRNATTRSATWPCTGDGRTSGIPGAKDALAGTAVSKVQLVISGVAYVTTAVV